MNRRSFLHSGAGLVIGSLTAAVSLGFIMEDQENESTIKKYKILSVRCNGCKHCLTYCKKKAISFADGKAVIDQEKCEACGDCLRSCRRQAIIPVK